MSNLEPDETAITVNVYVINYWLIQTVAVHQSWCRDNFISILLLILVLQWMMGHGNHSQMTTGL